jgi:hypothetical protein
MAPSTKKAGEPPEGQDEVGYYVVTTWSHEANKISYKNYQHHTSFLSFSLLSFFSRTCCLALL